MGDFAFTLSDEYPPSSPHAFPIGQPNSYPPDLPHSVSTSLPTWQSVIEQNEPYMVNMQTWIYPRFAINTPLKQLTQRIFDRLQITNANKECLLFPTLSVAQRFVADIQYRPPKDANGGPVDPDDIVIVTFSSDTDAGDTAQSWATFHAVLFPEELLDHATAFWRDTGDGMSTRHALYCMDLLPCLTSQSSCPGYSTPATKKTSFPLLSRKSLDESSLLVRERLADMARSDQPSQPPVAPRDVFLFPTGMSAIYCLAEALATLSKQGIVAAYGFLYPETVDVLRRGSWNTVLSYKLTTEQELDELEALLANGTKLTALFCELPSNIKFSSPNLPRIHAMARKYDFVVACDNSVVGHRAIDALPYVDVMITSLTKSFSGFSNVTGGSLVINPSSPHYTTIHSLVCSRYEIKLFPHDAHVLDLNSSSMAWRQAKSDRNALDVLSFLQSQSSIEAMLHPSVGPTSATYTTLLRRENGDSKGSYGNVMSIIFHRSEQAERFYNAVDVCKGASFGTNFTLAIPYAQLALSSAKHKLAKYGVPAHIIRLSVGMEDATEIIKKLRAAIDSLGDEQNK